MLKSLLLEVRLAKQFVVCTPLVAVHLQLGVACGAAEAIQMPLARLAKIHLIARVHLQPTLGA